MKENKLVDLFQSLTKLERKHFLAFVRSPYFNKKEELVRFVELLPSLLPDFSFSPETKTQLYTQITGATAYNDQQFRLFQSDLLQLLNQFLAHQALRQTGQLEDLLLLRALSARKREKHFRYTHRKIRHAHARRADETPGIHLEKYLLEATLADHLRENPRSRDTNMPAATDALDIFYIVQKLKNACIILNNQYVVDQDYELRLIPEIFALLQDRPFPGEPLVALYARTLRMFREPENEQHYTVLQELLREHRDRIPRQEAHDLYMFAQNYCIRQINRGKKVFMEHLFGIYKELLARELLLDAGQLSPWHYKNIVALGLRLDRTDWVADFIHGYRDRIPETFRDNAFTYNLARLYFHQRAQTQSVFRIWWTFPCERPILQSRTRSMASGPNWSQPCSGSTSIG
ncbi:MAG: hypothetical protein AAF570_04945, partial [Bacteroidota bacterium]